jgi:protein-S-isoprenylcysteine O-methyltransferase Ste14
MSSIETVKNILLCLLGLVVIWFFTISLPLWITASGFEPFPIEIGIFRFIGWIPVILGAFVILWCYWLFIFIGKGTPWPFDPPKELLVTGPYRYVRNPMESGYMLVLFGEVLVFESSALVFYLISSFLFLAIRQVLVEEPDLRRRFGQAYEQYEKTVPRWIPHLNTKIQKG